MIFLCSDSYENGITKEKVCTRIRQITFRVSRVPKQWTGSCKVSNTWTNLCNNMVEEKAKSRSRIPRKDSKKNEHACITEAVFCPRLGFGFHYPSIFEGTTTLLLQPPTTWTLERGGGGRLAWLWKFKAHQAPTVLIVTSRNPGHSAGAHWAWYFFPT